MITMVKGRATPIAPPIVNANADSRFASACSSFPDMLLLHRAPAPWARWMRMVNKALTRSKEVCRRNPRTGGRGGGGNVTPDGITHTVGAGNGMTLTAEGRLSGDSGSGTYDRSDGCSGTWIGIKQIGAKQRR